MFFLRVLFFWGTDVQEKNQRDTHQFSPTHPLPTILRHTPCFIGVPPVICRFVWVLEQRGQRIGVLPSQNKSRWLVSKGSEQTVLRLNSPCLMGSSDFTFSKKHTSTSFMCSKGDPWNFACIFPCPFLTFLGETRRRTWGAPWTPHPPLRLREEALPGDPGGGPGASEGDFWAQLPEPAPPQINMTH